MIQFLQYLKGKFPFLWEILEAINGIVFRIFFSQRFIRNTEQVLRDYENENYTYRSLLKNDLGQLYNFFQKQDHEQFNFFKPHGFDLHSLQVLHKNPSNFLFGVFNNDQLIGYFFIRCFINRTCFSGKLVDLNYQNQGIAKRMGRILINIAFQCNFRICATVSKENLKSLKSGPLFNNYKILNELPNNYIYIEYLRSGEKQTCNLISASNKSFIRIASKSDTKSIAQLHIETLNNSFLAGLKEDFVNSLYKYLIRYENVWVYEENNELKGFVSFSKNSIGMMKRFVIKNPGCLFLLLIRTIVQPANLKRLIETFRAPYKSQQADDLIVLPSGELLSISVSPDCQATGIGSRLLTALEDDLKQNRISGYKVVAGEELVGANKFYLKNGFVLAKQIRIHDEKLSNVYVRKLELN